LKKVHKWIKWKQTICWLLRPLVARIIVCDWVKFDKIISFEFFLDFLFEFSIDRSRDLFRLRLRDPTVRFCLWFEIRDVNAALTCSFVNSIELSYDSIWDKSK